jgi:hypothetical protein
VSEEAAEGRPDHAGTATPSLPEPTQTGRAPKVRLTPFDWAPLVERGFFHGMVTAYVGAGLGLILFDSSGMRAPSWLLIDVPLSILCALLAFARVWKTIREENETSTQWDDIDLTGYHRVLDRVFEIPYVFSIAVLPFSAIAPQLFMVTLALFYLTDNFYNAYLARGAAGVSSRETGYWASLATALRRSAWLRASDTRNGDDNLMVDFFRTRSHYNSAFLVVLAFTFVPATLFKFGGLDALAWSISFVGLSVIFVTEVFAEPRRNLPDELWPEGDQPAEALAEPIED